MSLKLRTIQVFLFAVFCFSMSGFVDYYLEEKKELLYNFSYHVPDGKGNVYTVKAKVRCDEDSDVWVYFEKSFFQKTKIQYADFKNCQEYKDIVNNSNSSPEHLWGFDQLSDYKLIEATKSSLSLREGLNTFVNTKFWCVNDKIFYTLTSPKQPNGFKIESQYGYIENKTCHDFL